MLVEYKEVNANGFVVDTHIFEDGSEIPINAHRSWGVDQSFYTPKWDNRLNKWVETANPPDPLDDKKVAKKNELELECTAAILGRFNAEVDGVLYSFSYDDVAQKNLLERWQLFQNKLIEEIKVTAKSVVEGEYIRLTVNAKQFEGIYVASVQYKENCISHYRDELLPLVDQASSVEAVEAITWETTVINPAPPPIVMKSDKTVDKQIDEMKMEQAQSSAEMVGLIMMMGGMPV